MCVWRAGIVSRGLLARTETAPQLRTALGSEGSWRTFIVSMSKKAFGNVYWIERTWSSMCSGTCVTSMAGASAGRVTWKRESACEVRARGAARPADRVERAVSSGAGEVARERLVYARLHTRAHARTPHCAARPEDAHVPEALELTLS